MKKKHLQQLIAGMDEKLAKAVTQLADLQTRLDFQVGVVEQLMAANDRYGREITELKTDLRETREALGGRIWKSQIGPPRWVSLLSTEHLVNIINNHPTALMPFILKEWERRKVDASMRKLLPTPKREKLYTKKELEAKGITTIRAKK